MSSPTRNANDQANEAEANGMTVNGVGEPVALVAAGLNSFKQLSASNGDIKALTETFGGGTTPRILFACWSTTITIMGNRLRAHGFQKLVPEIEGGASPETLRSAFGGTDGLIGCLDDEGKLYLVEDLDGLVGHRRNVCENTGHMKDFLAKADRRQTLVCYSSDGSPRIGNIALTLSGRVALTFKQAPNGRLCHLAEFSSFDSFLDWFEDPSGEDNYPEKHHMLPGRPEQLEAGTGTFALRTDSGQVYTWGDARYKSLGRSILGDDATPADQPGIVEALDGMKMAKISLGGWISAALSEDRALYVWGAEQPGNDFGNIHCLRPVDESEVSLVELPSDGPEAKDILDVAVGGNHIVAIDEDHHIWTVGENTNGQLGINSQEKFFDDWQWVVNVTGAKQVHCGHKATFAFVSKET